MAVKAHHQLVKMRVGFFHVGGCHEERLAGNGKELFWAGGGIVSDSDAGLEYAETLAKAAAFLELADG